MGSSLTIDRCMGVGDAPQSAACAAITDVLLGEEVGVVGVVEPVPEVVIDVADGACGELEVFGADALASPLPQQSCGDPILAGHFGR